MFIRGATRLSDLRTNNDTIQTSDETGCEIRIPKKKKRATAQRRVKMAPEDEDIQRSLAVPFPSVPVRSSPVLWPTEPAEMSRQSTNLPITRRFEQVKNKNRRVRTERVNSGRIE